MIRSDKILGVVLAGGMGRRMSATSQGTTRKGLLLLNGVPILIYVLRSLQPQVHELIVNANGTGDAMAGHDLAVVADDCAYAGKGPLAGLEAALTFAADRGFSAVASTPTDTPFIPDNMVAELYAHSNGGMRAGIAKSMERRHPTNGLWPVSMLYDVRNALQSEQLSIDRFAEAHGAIEVCFPLRDIGGQKVDPFFNINRPEDLQRADSLLKGMQ